MSHQAEREAASREPFDSERVKAAEQQRDQGVLQGVWRAACVVAVDVLALVVVLCIG